MGQLNNSSTLVVFIDVISAKLDDMSHASINHIHAYILPPLTHHNMAVFGSLAPKKKQVRLVNYYK